MTKDRINYIDYIKAFTIFCVLLGHSIQAIIGGGVFADKLHDIIYSFHMPLFMTLSGFFLSKSLSQPIQDVIKNKFLQLFLPVISFSTVVFLLKLISPIDFTEDMSYFGFIVEGGDMWFLKYLFICLLLASLCKLIFRNTLLAAILPACILISVSPVGIFRIYPFLWLGFMINHFKVYMERYSKIIIGVSGIVFLVLLFFWKMEYDYPDYKWVIISNSGISFDLQSLYVVAFRFLIGCAGSILVISSFYQIFGRSKDVGSNIFLKIGTSTLGIYCLQIYVLEKALDVIDMSNYPPLVVNVIIFAVAVAELFLCYYLTSLLNKNKYTALLFLGKKFHIHNNKK